MQFPRNANDCHFFYPFHLLGEATGHMSHLFFWNQPKPSVFLFAINSSSKSTELGQISRYHMMFPSTWRAPFLRTSPFFQRPTSAVKRIGNERYNLNRSERVSATFSRFSAGYVIVHWGEKPYVIVHRGEKYTCSRGEIQIYPMLVFCNWKGTNSSKRSKYPFVQLTNIVQWYSMP